MGTTLRFQRESTSQALAFFLRYALPGFVGSAVLAVGAIGAGWLPPASDLASAPIFDPLRSTMVGEFMSRAAVFVGVALLLQAWLVLGHDILDGIERNVARLWMALASWTVPLLVVPPLFSRDVYSYFMQGHVAAAGLNPYENGVSSIPGWFNAGADPMWSESPTPYGPLFILVERGLATLAGDSAYAGAILFRLVAVIGLALTAYFVPRLAFNHGIPPAKALWIGVMNPLVIMHFVAGAHNDALMVGLTVAALALASEGRGASGVAVLALAAAVKPIALVALPFIGLMWAGRRAGFARRVGFWALSGALTGVILIVLSAMAGVNMGWIYALGTPGAVMTWLSPPTALGMIIGGGLQMVGLASSNAFAVEIVRSIAMLAGAAICAYLVLRPERRSPVRGAALALMAVVLLGPVVQPWYLLWFLPLIAATGLTGGQVRFTMIATAGFVLHGLVESNATSDTLFDISDGIALVLAIGVVALALASSPSERHLVLGSHVDEGILPEGTMAKARARRAEFVGA